MGALDLAGVIGTWVAVGLAIIALIGIVGPLLVWKASQSDRNLALDRLDEGLASSGDYITKGVRFWSGKRLFRRVHAPDLSSHPQVAGLKTSWKSDIPLPTQESAQWVQLGTVLKAYGLGYTVGDCLIFEGTSPVVPVLKVSRTWIFVLGLIGRFGLRWNQGKCPVKRATGLLFDPAEPADVLLRRFRRPDHPSARPHFLGDSSDSDYSEPRDHFPGPQYPPPPFPEYPPDDRYRQSTVLHGLVGTLTFHEGGYVGFEAHQQDEIGELPGEAIDVAGLFWLFVGCIPSMGGKLLCLDNVQFAGAIPDLKDESFREDAMRTRSGRRPWEAHQRDPFNPEVPPPIKVSSRRSIQPTGISYVGAALDSTHVSFAPSDFDAPRRLHFKKTKVRVGGRGTALWAFANVVGAETKETMTMSLAEVTRDMTVHDEARLLREDAVRTFVPCDRPWIRLGPRTSSRGTTLFLTRADAQLLALALIQLPLCSQGYLIGKSPGSVCRFMLVESRKLLQPLLESLVIDFDICKSYGPIDACPHDQVERLKSSLSLLLYLLNDQSYNRRLAISMYELDGILTSMSKQEDNIRRFVQVVAITSPEFRDLIRQSVRNLKSCMDTSIVFDAKTATLNVGTYLGLVKKFPIDIDAVVEDSQSFERSGQTNIPYAEVILVVLGACVKSLFFKTSVDSTLLCHTILESADMLKVSF